MKNQTAAWLLFICMIGMVCSIWALFSFGFVFLSEAIGIPIKAWFIAAIVSSVGFIGIMATN